MELPGQQGGTGSGSDLLSAFACMIEANPVSIPDWEQNLNILASYYTVKDPLSTQKLDAF